MARKRMIYLDFFTSASLSRLDLRTALTFAGLWVYCDDYGRGEDDPEFIASVIYPRRRTITSEDVATDLAHLAETGKVCRYTVGNVPLFHIPSWHEHQTISHPTPSKLPPCPRCDTAVFAAWWRDDDTRTDRFRRAEKALRAAKTGRDSVQNGSGSSPENFAKNSGGVRERLRSSSGTTPSQCSSVEVSSVQAAIRAICGQLLWTTPGVVA